MKNYPFAVPISRFRMGWPIGVYVYSLHNDVTLVGLRGHAGPNPDGFREKKDCAANQNCGTCRYAYETQDRGPRSGKLHGWSLVLDCEA